jgi:hypothetical protein
MRATEYRYFMYWKCVDKPYVDEVKPHRYEFDQYFGFLGRRPE